MSVNRRTPPHRSSFRESRKEGAGSPARDRVNEAVPEYPPHGEFREDLAARVAPTERHSSPRSDLFGLLIAFCLMASASPVPTQGPQPRADFVFHVYVDPLFGDNLAASSFNPQDPAQFPAAIHALDLHPEPPISGVKRITGVLQHAPYAFRTLTSPVGQPGIGALDYIDALFPTLPFVNGNAQVTQVVIHCLPGLYGPLGVNPIDSQSGLPFNGEQFPIVIDRDLVALQGTSALDTIFDARGTQTSILRLFFGGGGQPPVNSHFNTFIDGVCFRNAVAGPATGSGAAIWVQGPSSIRAGITNCVFQGNAIGIALDNATANQPHDSTPARCLIVNNTFAANSIGIWAFRTGTQDPAPHAPAIVNNIFDLASPPGFPAGISCFENIDPSARLCASRGGQVVPQLDFNAFDNTRQANGKPRFFNIGVGIGSWPAPPASSQPEAPPRVDLAAFATQPRTFFIADALRLAPVGMGSSHDLRLSPEVSPTNQAPGTLVPKLPNPCVNMGIDGGPNRDRTIQMVNGRSIPGFGPGLPSFIPEPPTGLNPNAEEAPMCAWDFDCEGFGNPRIVLPSGFTDPSDDFGDIDIGADELDRLIVAGYLDGTRILAGPDVPNASPNPATDHRRVFFFGRSSTADVRPSASSLVGLGFDWYQHVQAPTDVAGFPFPTNNYTIAQNFPASLRFLQIIGAQLPRQPFMRNLVCDFSPHLAMDPHPFWSVYMGNYSHPPNPTFASDPYASNPWHENDANSVSPNLPADILSDNPFLFHNRHSIGHSLSFGPLIFPATTFVSSGHLNPPGTYSPSPSFTTWIVQPFFTFGPFTPCTGATIQFGNFCFNDAPSGCPDRVPEILPELTRGRRFNLEIAPGQIGNSNLQTFLSVFNVGILPASAGRGFVAPSQDPSREFHARMQEIQRTGALRR